MTNPMPGHWDMTPARASSRANALVICAGVGRHHLFGILSTGPLHARFRQDCHKHAFDGGGDAGFSTANATKVIGGVIKLVEDPGTRPEIAKDISASLHEAISAGMHDANMPRKFGIC